MVKLCDDTLLTDLNTVTIKDIEEVKNLLASKLILKSYNLSFTNITPSIVCIIKLYYAVKFFSIEINFR